ncbi:MAG TPA: gamma-glutamyl-gamma-aminobutyrate hydrolase family protein [Nocardioidaceae bacterium]|nr:gamma-glutamyl-gamma-aminobutyrate hydrolase family protein [Nocardioidaceae bacterium]
MRPLIGLTTYRETARWGVWNTSADLLPTSYATSVEAVEGTPVLLPPQSDLLEAARAVVTRIDGLIVSGGADVDPRRYGEEPGPSTTTWREDRDAWELALLDAAEEAALPTLGVCRGMQLMAVRAGGSLHQHTPDLVGHENHNPGGDAFGTVEVDLVDGSLVRALVGDRLSVHCHHHQSVREHPGFTAAAYAEDGTLEAMEVPPGLQRDRFCVAVQWHPEMAADAGLFRALVRAAAGHRVAREQAPGQEAPGQAAQVIQPRAGRPL